MHFTLNDDQRSKLTDPTKYQLRLYCTSSAFHSHNSPHLWSVRSCPIEFPPVCEIRVNGVASTANTRGMKKKPGTAPPVDLTKVVKTTGMNRIDITYINNTTPFHAKVSGDSLVLLSILRTKAHAHLQKFFLVANLVEVTSVDQLVERLRNRRARPAATVKADCMSPVFTLW